MAVGIDENRMLAGLFLRDKPAKILMGLRTNEAPVYVTILSKDANCTYSHTIKILNVLKELGIVDFEKKGRIKQVILTEAGEDIAKHLEDMVKKFVKIESGEKKQDSKAKKAKK
jgi:predicted transcriptional regulator